MPSRGYDDSASANYFVTVESILKTYQKIFGTRFNYCYRSNNSMELPIKFLGHQLTVETNYLLLQEIGVTLTLFLLPIVFTTPIVWFNEVSPYTRVILIFLLPGVYVVGVVQSAPFEQF